MDIGSCNFISKKPMSSLCCDLLYVLYRSIRFAPLFDLTKPLLERYAQICYGVFINCFCNKYHGPCQSQNWCSYNRFWRAKDVRSRLLTSFCCDQVVRLTQLAVPVTIVQARGRNKMGPKGREAIVPTIAPLSSVLF